MLALMVLAGLAGCGCEVVPWDQVEVVESWSSWHGSSGYHADHVLDLFESFSELEGTCIATVEAYPDPQRTAPDEYVLPAVLAEVDRAEAVLRAYPTVDHPAGSAMEASMRYGFCLEVERMEQWSRWTIHTDPPSANIQGRYLLEDEADWFAWACSQDIQHPVELARREVCPNEEDPDWQAADVHGLVLPELPQTAIIQPRSVYELDELLRTDYALEPLGADLEWAPADDALNLLVRESYGYGSARVYRWVPDQKPELLFVSEDPAGPEGFSSALITSTHLVWYGLQTAPHWIAIDLETGATTQSPGDTGFTGPLWGWGSHLLTPAGVWGEDPLTGEPLITPGLKSLDLLTGAETEVELPGVEPGDELELLAITPEGVELGLASVAHRHIVEAIHLRRLLHWAYDSDSATPGKLVDLDEVARAHPVGEDSWLLLWDENTEEPPWSVLHPAAGEIVQTSSGCSSEETTPNWQRATRSGPDGTVWRYSTGGSEDPRWHFSLLELVEAKE